MYKGERRAHLLEGILADLARAGYIRALEYLGDSIHAELSAIRGGTASLAGQLGKWRQGVWTPSAEACCRPVNLAHHRATLPSQRGIGRPVQARARGLVPRLRLLGANWPDDDGAAADGL